MATRLAFAGLAVVAMALPAVAQEFSFNQTCTLSLDACDMGRDGTEACATGQTVAAEFWSEGESFNLDVSGETETGFGAGSATFALGQGYVSDKLRVYYILGQAELDGVFWISVPDGSSGAHLTHGGLEDFFSGSCVPRG